MRKTDSFGSPTWTEENFWYHDAIAARAYKKWEARGGFAGSSLQDWIEAEAEATRTYSEAHELSERRMLAEHAVTRILTESAELIDAVPRILKTICESLDWDVGAFWCVDKQAEILRCIDFWHAPTIEVAEFEKVSRKLTFVKGSGLPGRVWASDNFAWIPEVTADDKFFSAHVAIAERLHAACAFPIHNGEFLGVMEFFHLHIREPDEKLVEMMACIGGQISQFIERRRVERAKRNRDHEFALARQIQQGWLPTTMPALPGFAFGGACQFCQETGGDYYDFFPVGDSTIGIALGDARGHGIGAALVMEEARATIRALALTRTDPGEILVLANRCLMAGFPAGHFVTMFLARVDPGSRSLVYCSAGHWPGYVLDRAGNVRLVLESTSLPLGIDVSIEYLNAPAITLLPGDLLCLFTDGIMETFSGDDSLFGIERALEIVRRKRHDSPDAIVQALFRAVRDFSGGQRQFDDLTAVIVKFEADA